MRTGSDLALKVLGGDNAPLTAEMSTNAEGSATIKKRAAELKLQGVPVDSTLGALITMHHGRGLDRFSQLSVLYPGLLIILLFLGYGVWRGYYGYTNYGSVAAYTWSRPGLLLGAGLSFILAIWLFIRRWQADRYIALYENGLRFRIGRQKNVPWRWSEIGGITVRMEKNHFIGFPMLTRNQLVISPNIGDPLRLDDRIQDLDQLIPLIKEHFYPYLTKALRAQFFGDHWVHFGPVAIHRQALRIRKKMIPWKQVVNIGVREGKLEIEIVDGRPIRIPTVKIPNLEVCLNIIQEGVIP